MDYSILDCNLLTYKNGASMNKSIHSKNYTVLLEQLREARVQAGITQEGMATRLDETQSFISKCERGERRLDILELRAWCLALGISLTEFVTRLDRTCGD